MEDQTHITERGIIVMGNIGKFIYRIFIVVILYNIYTHLLGETTFLAVSTFLLMFPILWMTMKELSKDLHYHDNKAKNHDSEELATKQTIPTINEDNIKDNRIILLEETLENINSQLKDANKYPIIQRGIESVLNETK